MIIRQVFSRFTKQQALKRKQQLRKSFPNIVTLGNACFGFISITQSLQGNVVAAAYCILVAALFDFLDGRVARYLSCVSYMGAELDSLSDAVSFCVAPATLLYSYCLQNSGICATLILSGYLCAGLFRLARFNVVPNQSNMFFVGLPTPIAACFLSSIVMYQAWLVQYGFSMFTGPDGLMVCSLLIALFMVSTIPCFSFKRYKVTHRYGSLVISMGLICAVFGFACQYPVLFFVSLLYIVGMFMRWCVGCATRWKV